LELNTFILRNSFFLSLIEVALLYHFRAIT